MHPEYDKYAKISGIIHYWDIRHKLISLFILIITISFLSNVNALSASCLIVFILVSLSKLPFNFVLKKFKIPLIFFSILLITFPLLTGNKIIFTFLRLNFYYEGLIWSLKILTRGFCIITLIIIAFETSPFEKNIKSLYRIKIPKIIVSLIQFTHRYFYLYKFRVKKMQIALTLKGYNHTLKIRNIKAISGIIINLFIQSFEQTDRVINAMNLRGFNGNFVNYETSLSKKSDYIKSLIIILFSISLILIEVL